MNIADAFLRTAERNPGSTFLVAPDDRAYSYGEIASRVRRMVTFLEREGLGFDDRLILTFPNSVDYLCAYLGTLLRGCTVVLVDYDSLPARLDYVRKDVDASAWMSPGSREDYAHIPSHRPFPEDLDRFPEAAIKEGPTSTDGSPALVLYTSGTTGAPKGVCLSHENLAHTIGAITQWAGIEPGERELTTLSLTHLFGLAHVHIHWTLGGTVYLEEGLSDIPRILDRMERHRITSFPGTPAGFRMILSHFADRFREAACDLRYIIINSAPMRVPDVERLLELVPHVRCYMYYGLTEASRSTYIHYNEHPDKLETVGCATPGAEVRVVEARERQQDARTGDELEPLVGEPGEVLVRGPHVTRGYWGKDSAEHFTDGWFHTGDLGIVDEDGFLTWKGRVKEQINVDGRKISPAEVEAVLKRHDLVRDCAVVGAPDPLTGEAVVAFVVSGEAGGNGHAPGTGSGETSRLSTDIRRFCKPHIEFYKIPRRVHFIDQIPRTDTGKVKRLSLLERIEE